MSMGNYLTKPPDPHSARPPIPEITRRSPTPTDAGASPSRNRENEQDPSRLLATREYIQWVQSRLALPRLPPTQSRSCPSSPLCSPSFTASYRMALNRTDDHRHRRSRAASLSESTRPDLGQMSKTRSGLQRTTRFHNLEQFLNLSRPDVPISAPPPFANPNPSSFKAIREPIASSKPPSPQKPTRSRKVTRPSSFVPQKRRHSLAFLPHGHQTRKSFTTSEFEPDRHPKKKLKSDPTLLPPRLLSEETVDWFYRRRLRVRMESSGLIWSTNAHRPRPKLIPKYFIPLYDGNEVL
ncbi:hypothetical protein CROQUDRAFT_133810 [Cronartium quercuum f. sp. fusiforme G11]|uniref:Uncharacterized protein n=1 Tax=Cronartium quercuum f. sp. fusiforme G11 TaxID=708437 RepID=A0A9P6NKM6_9BASI|nr:hypothetical protein CROQUDRAFT_133810 [Cronartium quercuum f. sp. fusiforme G11]